MYTLPVGTKITSPTTTYTITGVLGQGGFGITYSAIFTTKVGAVRVKASVALKELFVKADCVREENTLSVSCSGPAQQRVELARKDFVGEARRLQQLNDKNPHIVAVNEVFEANNTAYFAMEMLEGKSLRDYVVARGHLSEGEMLSIMTQIIDAVAFLHRNRITHLDIKPQNIMITTDDGGTLRPVLIDFGLSKHYDENGEATSTINSQGYSEGYAPSEQYRGITTFSPASDVYSLGATMVYCLTGKGLPSALDLRPETLEEAIPADTTQKVRRAIRRALSLHAEDRQADAGALLADLGGKKPPIAAPTPAATSEATVVDAYPKEDAPEATIIDANPKAPSPATPTKEQSKRPKPKRPWLKITSIVVGALLLGYIVYPRWFLELYYGSAYESSEEGLYKVRNKYEKHGFVNRFGKEVIPLVYDYANDFSEGLAYVKKNGKYGFINKSGDVVIPLIYDDATSFKNGKVEVKKDGEQFYIDKTGKRVE